MGEMSNHRGMTTRRPAPPWTLADRLRRVRRDMHLTQAEMADLIGVGHKAYASWEAGQQPGKLTALAVDLERATGVDRTWWLGWDELVAKAALTSHDVPPEIRCTQAPGQPSPHALVLAA